MPEEPIIHVEIEADTLADLKAFADESQPDLGCRPVARRVAGKFVIHAYLPEPQLAAARTSPTAARITIRVIENATEVGRQRQQEVGRGNKFANRSRVPRGLGRKE
jgi:hypothetical protein